MKLKPLLKLLTVVLFLFHFNSAIAQQDCAQGSTTAPIFTETFGAAKKPTDTIGSALPSGRTNYTYLNGWPDDGKYTISFRSNPKGGGTPFWYDTTDHTGDKNGYMMVVNAAVATGEFYRQRITGLCQKTTFVCSVWAANVNTPSISTLCQSTCGKPNILIKIENTSGAVLNSITTGSMPFTSNGLVWTKYSLIFSPQSGQSTIDFVLVNNGPGGDGNDLVLDDISFRICLPNITLSTDAKSCEGKDVTINGVVDAGFNDAQMQWQVDSGSGVWKDLPGDTTKNLIVKKVKLPPPSIKYRLVVAERGNVQSQNCRAVSNEITINIVPNPKMTVSPITNISCYGKNNGSATINASGGVGNLSYLWLPGGQTTSIATGLSPGTYTLTVSDANSCTASSNSVVITEPALLTHTSSKTNIACNGNNTGAASVTVTGGITQYTYNWNNSQTSTSITGLIAGTYSVLITDKNGCTNTETFSITEPPLLIGVPDSSLIRCNGESNGYAELKLSGGTKNYTYTWSNGKTSSAITGMPAGTYSVLAVDANGCSKTHIFTLTQPNTLTVSVNQTNVACSGHSTGVIDLTSLGGTKPYAYTWNNGSTTPKITGLTAGTYSLNLIDSNKCLLSKIFIITEPKPLKITASQKNIICSGGNTGTATADLSGGVKPYTYRWTNGQTTSTTTGLPEGNYTVTITDANLCSAIDSFRITQSLPISISVLGVDSLCMGLYRDLSASVQNGTPPLTYLWNPGSYTTSVIHVSPTTTTSYSVVVTDIDGCSSALQVFTLRILPIPKAGFDTIPYGELFTSTYLFNDLSINPIHWYWTFGNGQDSKEQSPIHSFPGTGTYYVTQVVYNQHQCTDTARVTLVLPLRFVIPNVFTPDGDGINDEFYIPNSGAKAYHLIVYDRWGLKIFESTSSEVRWDGKSQAGQDMSTGTYFYTIEAILQTPNNEGQVLSHKGSVALLRNKK